MRNRFPALQGEDKQGSPGGSSGAASRLRGERTCIDAAVALPRYRHRSPGTTRDRCMSGRAGNAINSNSANGMRMRLREGEALKEKFKKSIFTRRHEVTEKSRSKKVHLCDHRDLRRNGFLRKRHGEMVRLLRMERALSRIGAGFFRSAGGPAEHDCRPMRRFGARRHTTTGYPACKTRALLIAGGADSLYRRSPTTFSTPCGSRFFATMPLRISGAGSAQRSPSGGPSRRTPPATARRQWVS